MNSLIFTKSPLNLKKKLPFLMTYYDTIFYKNYMYFCMVVDNFILIVKMYKCYCTYYTCFFFRIFYKYLYHKFVSSNIF